LNFCRLDGAIQDSYNFFLTISFFYIPYPFYSLLLAILRFRIEFSSRCALSSLRAIYKVSGIFLGIFLLLEDSELKRTNVLSSPGGVSEYLTQLVAHRPEIEAHSLIRFYKTFSEENELQQFFLFLSFPLHYFPSQTFRHLALLIIISLVQNVEILITISLFEVNCV
jgi:hypothetical protein